MNMAVVLQLPVIFVFENNGFGEGTGHDYAVGSKDIAGRAAALVYLQSRLTVQISLQSMKLPSRQLSEPEMVVDQV